MARYVAVADNVVSGTALKTILQVTAGSAHRLKVISFGVGFQGTSSTAEPGEVRLQRQTTAGTGSAALTSLYGPNAFDSGDTVSTSATAVKGPAGTWTAEPTAGAILWAQPIHPQAGLDYLFPLGQEPLVDASGRVAVVVTFAATVDVWGWICWEE